MISPICSWEQIYTYCANTVKVVVLPLVVGVLPVMAMALSDFNVVAPVRLTVLLVCAVKELPVIVMALSDGIQQQGPACGDINGTAVTGAARDKGCPGLVVTGDRYRSGRYRRRTMSARISKLLQEYGIS